MNNFKVINSNTIIKDLEEENKKLKNKIKVLASKVKTYEADIEADIKDSLHNYSYHNNCYCVKCFSDNYTSWYNKSNNCNYSGINFIWNKYFNI